MQKYSIFSLIKNAFTNHQNWDVAWRDPVPKKEYDAIIIGGGGHGLATAYYLAKEHKITNVAILEKGWIGGGNVEEIQRFLDQITCGTPMAFFMNMA